jgi:CBS domain-containing protein
MTADLDLYSVPATATIHEAMQRIEANRHRVVVVVDEERRVLGTVSDGDLRRAFLHQVLQLSPVTAIMQLNPRVAGEDALADPAAALKREHVTLLPIVTPDNRLVDVLLAYEPLIEE